MPTGLADHNQRWKAVAITHAGQYHQAWHCQHFMGVLVCWTCIRVEPLEVFNTNPRAARSAQEQVHRLWNTTDTTVDF
jgi:hypothetical protein